MKIWSLCIGISTAYHCMAAPYSTLDAYTFSEPAIKGTIRKAAEYQLKRYGKHIPTKNWLVGTFFSSFIAAYEQTDDDWYLEQALKWGERSEWDIRNPLNADDVCPGQTYLDLYFIKRNKAMLKNLTDKLSVYFGREVLKAGEFHEWHTKERPFIGRNLWSWCDSLYMAPPVYARLGKATGDKRYHEQLHQLYWDSVDYLYDTEEQLFFRDGKYLPSGYVKSPTGNKVFWGRGNGWVIGGLARMIEFLPDDDPKKQDYIDLFTDLAFGIAKYQQEDGLWRSSLSEPSWQPVKETSGSSFFVYAMAKGINEGWLPREYFEPVVLKGWRGLIDCVTPEGRLGYCQLVAGSPNEVRPKDSKDYAVGAFILAGCEMLRMNAEESFAKQISFPFKPELVAKDGTWTWFNDERVLFHKNVFYVGYVKSTGKSAMTTYGSERLPSSYAMKEYELSSWNQNDDRNNPSFLSLANGEILATYGQHGTSSSFYQRTFKLPRWDEPVMSEEKTFNVVSTKHGLSSQNLYRLSGEDERIYNFFRGNNFNPHFVTSDDDAQTWSEPIHLITAGKDSSHHPYVKYVSNNKDRIDFFYTDGHPRACKQNNIYHFYYQSGSFYKIDGTKLRTMEQLKKRPIKVNEGTLVFNGSTPKGRGWVHDLEYDVNGQPFGALISSPSGDTGSDMRYWTARVKNGQWTCKQIAYAGSNLCPEEEHYAGGITLDPFNDQQVIISADVNPESGEPLPQRIYQLFKGTRSADGTWTWQQLTHDTQNNHLRPTLVRGRKNSLFWFSGQYRTYKDDECRIYGAFNF